MWACLIVVTGSFSVEYSSILNRMSDIEEDIVEAVIFLHGIGLFKTYRNLNTRCGCYFFRTVGCRRLKAGEGNRWINSVLTQSFLRNCLSVKSLSNTELRAEQGQTEVNYS